MLNRKVMVVALLVLFTGVMTASAGEISGVVVFKDGSKAKGVGVSGLTSGLFGGVTKKVFTDNQGRFRLTWSSKKDLAKVYVKGNTVARNIKNGSQNVKLVIR